MAIVILPPFPSPTPEFMPFPDKNALTDGRPATSPQQVWAARITPAARHVSVETPTAHGGTRSGLQGPLPPPRPHSSGGHMCLGAAGQPGRAHGGGSVEPWCGNGRMGEWARVTEVGPGRETGSRPSPRRTGGVSARELCWLSWAPPGGSSLCPLCGRPGRLWGPWRG